MSSRPVQSIFGSGRNRLKLARCDDLANFNLILSTKHSVTPYIFYIKPPSWIEGKIENIGVQYRSGSTDKSVLEQTIKFIFVEYFIHTCLTLLKVQSFPIFYQLFYKQRPVKFSITVHITDTGTLKQTIFFTNISPSGENL